MIGSIAGWIDYEKNVKNYSETIYKMGEALKPRGNGALKEFKGTSCVLIERKNSAHSAQRTTHNEGNNNKDSTPMPYALCPMPYSLSMNGEDYVIVLDGRLFNLHEVKGDLARKGYSFDSDTHEEIMLKAYIEWGRSCLDRFNGAYAFAIWETRKQTLFVARDRIGVKPFFFYQYGSGLVFASEIKTLMQNKIVKPILDSDGLKQIMLIGPGRGMGAGIIKGVKELKAGEFMVFSRKGAEFKTYWRLMAHPHTDNLGETVIRTRELITDSIERQLSEDSASFLSGGLDSSIISLVASNWLKERGETLSTFSVDYDGNDEYFVGNAFQPDSDGKYIDIMSRFTGSPHTNIVLNSLEVADALSEASIARGLPGMADIDSSLLLFCREVKKTHNNAFSGECADELFGGYPWYHNPSILFQDTFPWSQSIDLRKLLFKQQFVGKNPEEFVKNEYQKTIATVDYLDTDNRLEVRMREMFVLNFYWFMQTLIERGDRMSAYNQIDLRIPFCDYRIAEYAFNMPWHLKSLNNREKGILREAFKGLLPEEVRERKKSPFPKTFNPVFLDFVSKKAGVVVKDKYSLVGELINQEFLNDLRTTAYEVKAPWYGQLMRMPQIFAYLIQLDCFIKSFGLRLEI
ncbi:MAG: asparagine synthase (glutamine-hydrolyzing) [Firmicutes bacterium]|nr:asparagine synthase (glutamine-hydrolyzing) [Bacillota bacterium]